MPPRTELNLTPANILGFGFAKKYSMYAMDAAAGYVPSGQTMLTGKYAGFRHTVVGNTQNVAHIKVERETQAGRNRAADFLVKPSLTEATGTPSYFLPWDSRGAAVEMTIPPLHFGRRCDRQSAHLLHRRAQRLLHRLQGHARKTHHLSLRNRWRRVGRFHHRGLQQIF